MTSSMFIALVGFICVVFGLVLLYMARRGGSKS